MPNSEPPSDSEYDSEYDSYETEEEEFDPNDLRTVYLPLEKLGECCVCKKKESLRLCASCGEVNMVSVSVCFKKVIFDVFQEVYCSKECQKQQWPSHKQSCGTTRPVFCPFQTI
jgi:hypothetical protein